MLVPKKISPQRRALMLAGGAFIIGLSIFLLYDRFVGVGGPSADLDIVAVEVRDLPRVETNFSSDFINKRPYTTLEQNGRLPVQPSATGRPNPFAEIPFSLIGG